MDFYSVLDVFFMILHPAIILFNRFGWIRKKTRIYNLILLLLTAFSWFILGIWKGWGYCFLTDWHYRVLEKMGYHDLPNSYIKFLIARITGIDFDERLVNVTTAIVFFVVMIISLRFNMRDWKETQAS